MLDENLPTFHFRPSTDNPLNTVLHFTHNGSDPAPAFLLRRPDPANSQSKNRYAIAVADPSFADAIYGEVLVEPEWQLPSLSAAEMRSQNGLAVPPTPLVPETFVLQLYNPDQQVVVKRREGGFAKSESWEFEMPERSFRIPSASRIDREASDPLATDLVPRVMFRWKRDGRLNKDMTCYLVGKSVQGKKNKEPDITIALFKQGRNDTALAVYEPNMQRVDVEDRKGLEVVLLLGCEAIRDLYMGNRQDVFNTAGASAPQPGGRKNSKPLTPPAAIASGGNHAQAMSGALNNTRPSQKPPSPSGRQDAKEIDAETKRLQAMVAEEKRQAREREKRDRTEQERIKKMLEREEKERQKKQAQIDRETEELRKKYGVQGQTFPAASSSSTPQPEIRPNLPARRGAQGQSAPPPKPQPLGGAMPGSWGGGSSGYAPPLRPSSAGPYARPQQTVQFAPPPQQAMQPPAGQSSSGGHHNLSNIGFGKHQKKVDGIVNALSPYTGPAAATVSGFFHGKKEDTKTKKVHKKRSVHF